MTRHPDYLALYAAVLAAPDDDAPRLVLADWLTENGEADRGEFIRWAVANPQNSAVCLCLAGRRQPQPCETCQLLGDEIAGIPRRPDGETHYVVNRGFVSEVRIPCRRLVECERCEGPAEFLPRGARRGNPCPACGGTGAGLAARLREWPLETVRITDREPYLSSREAVGSWLWYDRTGNQHHESDLTPDLFALLPGPTTGENTEGQSYKTFPTRDAALAALGAAALAFVRRTELAHALTGDE